MDFDSDEMIWSDTEDLGYPLLNSTMQTDLEWGRALFPRALETMFEPEVCLFCNTTSYNLDGLRNYHALDCGDLYIRKLQAHGTSLTHADLLEQFVKIFNRWDRFWGPTANTIPVENLKQRFRTLQQETIQLVEDFMDLSSFGDADGIGSSSSSD